MAWNMETSVLTAVYFYRIHTVPKVVVFELILGYFAFCFCIDGSDTKL